MAKTNYTSWTMGKTMWGSTDYWTYNPPRKPKVEPKVPTPKDEIIYRERFILRPVYRHIGDAFSRGLAFIGYLTMWREDGRYWFDPKPLAAAKQHADSILTYVRACEAIACTLQSVCASIETQNVAA